MKYLVYCLVRNAVEEDRANKGAKQRFQFAGIFLLPDLEAYDVDRDPLSVDSRRRRFITIGFVRPAVGQTCVPWKEPQGSGREIPVELLPHIGLATHVTTPEAASQIIWDGLKPGVLAHTTNSLELQLSPFPPFDKRKRAELCGRDARM